MKSICLAILLFFGCYGGPMANQELEKRVIDDVIIGPNAISMPIGRILLVKKLDSIWALKFIDYGVKKGEGYYSKFTCYKFDGVMFKEINKGIVSFYEPTFWHRILHIFKPNSHRYASGIKCGFQVFAHAGWDVECVTVYFGIGPDLADESLFLAPTPWKEPLEINLSDLRIIWYQYDKNRKDQRVHINKLWE